MCVEYTQTYTTLITVFVLICTTTKQLITLKHRLHDARLNVNNDIDVRSDFRVVTAFASLPEFQRCGVARDHVYAHE